MCFTLHSHQTMDTSCHSDKCMALCWKQQQGWEDTKRHNDVPAPVALLGKANQYDICSARSPPQRTIWWVTLKNRVRAQNVCGSASIPAFREQRATAGMTMTKSPFCNGWRSTSLHGKFEVVCRKPNMHPLRAEIISCLILWVIYSSWRMLCFWSWCLINIRPFLPQKEEKEKEKSHDTAISLAQITDKLQAQPLRAKTLTVSFEM